MDIKKVLIVEDDSGWQNAFKYGIDGKFDLYFADSITNAEILFREISDVDCIIMDACVPGDEPNTMDLVKEIRKTYKGPIIANSSVEEYVEELLGAGCDYGAHKRDVIKKIFEILSLNEQEEVWKNKKT